MRDESRGSGDVVRRDPKFSITVPARGHLATAEWAANPATRRLAAGKSPLAGKRGSYVKRCICGWISNSH